MNSEKTPQWKIDEMRKLYQEGYSLEDIAAKLSTSRETVGRYCSDLSRPVKRRLKTCEIDELMREWK